jgi:anthranilate/para-aminobenzoate synthase component II
MNQVYIIDFEDSFTYNIAAYFHKLNIATKVISYTSIEASLNDLSDDRKKVLIWGPGPKHPYQYQEIMIILNFLRQNERIFHMGICLGHQIMLASEGYSIVPATDIIHGQKIDIIIPEWDTFFDQGLQNKSMAVQRYNSLAVQEKSNNKIKSYIIDQEVMIAGYHNGVSYQFHPESIGTSFPDAFFDSTLKFLYNVKDGRNTQNSRYI